MTCTVEFPYTTRTLTAVDSVMRYDWRSGVFPITGVDAIDAVTDPRNPTGNFVCIPAYRLFKARPDQGDAGVAFTGTASAVAQYLSESMSTPAASKMYGQAGVGYKLSTGSTPASAEVGFYGAYRACGLFGGVVPIQVIPGAANQSVTFSLGKFPRRGVAYVRASVIQMKAQGTGYVKNRLAARTFATDPNSPSDWSALESGLYDPGTRAYDDRNTGDVDPSLGSNMWGELALSVSPTTSDMSASLLVAWSVKY